ncbi:helix-turn-helix domain-containing protein [Lentzea sp. BCCO 10_0798]|uniref:Helix-turn-helix domain-containing protein n=1 Tax=Lentzea kristufekii TaxID=3095430 RepID=A0ABU4TZ14_9PSEU|nr:helix-turn-helix domain-containing protein [Lentzea sp. BCCO 10_0798]MDX8053486.1 helix-turn-helix domain-containing protein [Lentzea sp. BCCO 10_0798]
MNDDMTGVGKRVADGRKFAGWNQQELARRTNFSVSLVRKVEQGRTPASPAFVSACARALNVGVADLLELPYPRLNREEHRVHGVIPVIRRELAAYNIGPDEDVQVRDLGELALAVEHVSQLRHAVNLDKLGAEIPGLLEELRAATYTLDGSAKERAFGLLAEAYNAASQFAYKLGYIDLASLAVDRYEWAAERSGDELAVLIGDYQRAGEMICAADWSSALRLLERSRSRIEDQVGGNDLPTIATWGNLHLKSGLAAARSGQRELAYDHLAQAQEAATRLGVDRDDYRLCFGPTNVGIWSVGLAVELLDGTEAIKRAERIVLPSNAPKERVGHHYIDLARGLLIHGDRRKAFASLSKAREVAPTQTRYHPMVHETLRVLVRDEHRRTDTLSGFARWAGLNL